MFQIRNILVALVCLAGYQVADAGWIKQDSGTLAWLRSVYFVDQQRGWIAGSRGTLLATTDGGNTWKIQKRVTEDNIRDVYFSDEQNGWLLCERNINKIGSASLSYFLRTADGGRSWESNELPLEKERIVRVFFTKGGTGFGIGEGGAWWRTENSEKSWKKHFLPTLYLLQDGMFMDDLHGILVGAAGTILVTEDGGLNWSRGSLEGGNEKTKFSSVFFTDKSNGWAAGTSGSIYCTKNGGRLWRRQESIADEDLSDIVFINPTKGFAVGDKGKILETNTGGRIWTMAKTVSKAKLESAFFTGPNGFAVGYGGTILKYSTAKIANTPKLNIIDQ